MTAHLRPESIVLICLAALAQLAQSCTVSSNQTCITDVRAIQNLGFALYQRKSNLRGWNSSDPLDPCGYRDCSEGAARRCNYQGLTCEDWRIVRLELDCHVARGLCGSHQRMIVPPELHDLSALTHLQLSNSWIAGNLPAWDDWPTLKALNLSGNMLNGPLPNSWASLTNLAVIDVSENQLAGKLPGSWSSMRNLRTLALNNNGLQGTIPPSWIQLDLAALDIRYNCGLCGTLVSFGKASISIEGTNIGGTCHAFNCNSQFFAHIMIIVSLVFGVLALCLLQRHLCMRCRNRRLRDRMAAGLIGQSTNQDDPSASASTALKLSQLAVVVMPDGQTVAFGRKLSSDNLERAADSSNNLKAANMDTTTTSASDTAAPADTGRREETHVINPLLAPGGTTTITITRESDVRDTSQPPSIDVSAELPGQPATNQASGRDNQEARSWVQRRLSLVRPFLGLSGVQPAVGSARRPAVRSVAPTGVQVTGMRFDSHGNPM